MTKRQLFRHTELSGMKDTKVALTAQLAKIHIQIM